jgi:hypothetical protein
VTIRDPGPGAALALASAHHTGCRVVASFIDQEVWPRVNAAAASTSDLRYLRGILLRVRAWLRTIEKLNEPSDFQAAAAGARAVFEISVDLTLLQFDKARHTFDKVRAWEASAQHRHGITLARHYDGKPGRPVPGVAAKIATAKRLEAEAQTDRAKRWPTRKGKVRHADRWTGRDLGTDATEAEKLAARGFVDFYANHYQRICWYVHGSGLAVVEGLNAELFPVLSTIALQTIGQFAIVVAEMALRLAGCWEADANRAIQLLGKARMATIGKVFAEHPARKAARTRKGKSAGRKRPRR